MTKDIKRGRLLLAAMAFGYFAACAPCAKANYIAAASHPVPPAEEIAAAPYDGAAIRMRGLDEAGWMAAMPAPDAAGQTYGTATLQDSAPHVVVPEPATIALLGVGLIGLTLLRRRAA